MSLDLTKPLDCSEPIQIGERTFRLTTDFTTGKRDGNQLWPVAVALAQIVAKQQLPCRVCCVGDGLGLVGIVAVSQGAEVTVVEKDIETCILARNNFVTNEMPVDVRAENWSETQGQFDSIFGSECAYSNYGLDALCQFIKRCWTREGRCLFAVSLDRSVTEFEQQLTNAGLMFTLTQTEFEYGGDTAKYLLWEVLP